VRTTISVIIPAHESGVYLERCLEALRGSRAFPLEVIVVADGPDEAAKQIAAKFPAIVLSTGSPRGPAFARNLGARAAAGEILLFLDSDVCVQPGTLGRIQNSFDADPALDALIGSYDSEPESSDFLSQYRNLMHCYFHQAARTRASTFWSGCGAIRKEVFRTHCGFDEEFGRPAIEDIELGYRLLRSGRKILLDRALQVTHLKRWTFWNLVKTDVLDRGIPWTELILRDRVMPDDLNLQLSQRVSVALVFLLVALSALTAVFSGGTFLIPLFAIVLIMLARWWGEFGAADRPLAVPFVVIGLVLLIAVLAYRYKMLGLIPPLMLSPSILVIQHRYGTRGTKPTVLRWLALLYSTGSILLAIQYLPATSVFLLGFLLVAVLGLLNSQFYIFLAAKRGVPFMLAAIPFHLLYHFYNGISFTVGVLRHVWLTATRTARVPG
jgi:cellulose synthase/poly-beta-1,6-N-acetylglucosamine synthase-like glycosyltransferase